MAFETDAWKFVQARHFGDTNTRQTDLVVVHDMEAPEKATTAEAVANYFASGKVKASAHLCIDNDSIVQCVRDGDVAYAAPGANHNGLQLELAGYARQTRAEWLDVYSRNTIENAAKATAQYCLKFSIPVKKLTNAQLKAGERGIISHAQASQVFKKSSHTDPGVNFPWDFFIERVRYWTPYYRNGRKWPVAPKPVPQPTPVPTPTPNPEPATGGNRVLVRFNGKNEVYEVVGSHLEHITLEAFNARGLTQAQVVVVDASHPLNSLPKTAP